MCQTSIPVWEEEVGIVSIVRSLGTVNRIRTAHVPVITSGFLSYVSVWVVSDQCMSATQLEPE